MARQDATKRFSNRVECYIRYRPRYPEAIVGVLQRECGLTADTRVADIGSGTGMLAELFLRLGCRVIGVEPNREMRAGGDRVLAGFPRFSSIEASAEVTTLPAACVDLVSAGQAFHWFDRERARAEFARILQTGGTVALVWNKRRRSGTPFAEGYEAMLRRFSIDYGEVDHDRVTPEVIAAFFHPEPYVSHTFLGRQALDFEVLRGRLESASYVPPPGDPGHPPMIAELRRLFDANSEDGAVPIEIDTVLYHGRLT